ncbi:MAG: tetratricopeptide repeat protein [PVC group bacterium]|nr:tetratricopeptide repeat protein [PVC group bacterium]
MFKKIVSSTVIIFSMLSLTGCGEGTYVAEKKFYHAQRRFAETEKNAKDGQLTDAQIDEAILDFKEIVMRYPKWEPSLQAQFKLALLYNKKGNYKQAVKEFEKVCTDFAVDIENGANALRHIANIWEQQNNWLEAEKVYKSIQKDYTYTLVGVLVPIYLAQRYYSIGETEKSRIATIEALDFYKDIIEKQPESIPAAASVNHAADCLRSLGRKEEMIAYLESLLEKYPNALIAQRALLKLAGYYQLREKDNKKASMYYQKLIDNYPNSKLSQKAAKEIKKLTEK